jgi:hypothetical protein
MLSINFNLCNPWSNRWDTLWVKSRLLSATKAVEFNGYHTNSLINVDFSFSVRTDHAGFRLMLGLFGYDAELHFYDTRHWDRENGQWTVYSNKKDYV